MGINFLLVSEVCVKHKGRFVAKEDGEAAGPFVAWFVDQPRKLSTK